MHVSDMHFQPSLMSHSSLLGLLGSFHVIYEWVQ